MFLNRCVVNMLRVCNENINFEFKNFIVSVFCTSCLNHLYFLPPTKSRDKDVPNEALAAGGKSKRA